MSGACLSTLTIAIIVLVSIAIIGSGVLLSLITMLAGDRGLDKQAACCKHRASANDKSSQPSQPTQPTQPGDY